MVLSAPPVMSLVPVLSNAEQKTPWNQLSLAWTYGLGVQRSRLWYVLQVLKWQSGGVVPHGQGSIVRSGKHDAFVADA